MGQVNTSFKMLFSMHNACESGKLSSYIGFVVVVSAVHTKITRYQLLGVLVSGQHCHMMSKMAKK